jgi:Protein of unknown function (DUF1631)
VQVQPETPTPAALLERHLQACLADIPRWMAAMTGDALRALQSPSGTPSLRGSGAVPMREVETALTLDGTRWGRRAVELVAARWQQELAPPAARASGLQRLSHSAFDQLALVDEAEAAENVEILKIVQGVESQHEPLLRELAARGATLRGDDSVKRGSNLLRPELMVRAVLDASETLVLSPGARLVLVRVAAVPLVQALGSALSEALQRLERWGVAPAAWRATALPGRRLAAPAASGFDVTRPGALDMLRGRMEPQVPIGTPGAPEGLPDAMLTRVLAAGKADADPLANRLIERLPLLEAAARQVIERQVIELIARLVDAMLHDEQLRQPVRAAVALLQVPLLRLALTEPGLFDDHRHPAWRFLNGLGAWTIGYDDDADPRLCGLMRSVSELCARIEVAPTIDGATFERALAELEFIFETDLSAERAEARDQIERLRRAEQRGELRISIRRNVQSRLHAAAPDGGLRPAAPADGGLRLSETLKRFLTGPWVDAVVAVAQRDGEDAPQVQALLSWVDELLRSLAPPRSAEERQRLLRAVPGLVQRLQQGLAHTRLVPSERQAVLDELAERHMELLRPDLRAPAEALTPAELVRRLRDEEPAPVVGPSADTQGPDSLLDFGTLHTVPAELLDGAGAVAPRDWSRHLAPGIWCRFVPRGSWTVARLLWVGERQDHLLFSDADLGITHALTRAAFERLVVEQLAAPLEERSLLERAVDSLVVGRAG